MRIITKNISYVNINSLPEQKLFLRWKWKKEFKNLRKNLSCGIHSRFRICDVLFFSLFWTFLVWTVLGDKYRKFFRKKAGYIECPICSFIIKPKLVKVKSCNCLKECC